MKNILTLLFMFSVSLGFSQPDGTTGITTTQDKYSTAINNINSEYFENKYESMNAFMADDITITINGENITKEQWIQGCKIHHQLYSDIKWDPYSFVDTTVYNKANNNTVWSHVWGSWSGKSKRTGEVDTNPVNFSYQWINGKITLMNGIYDPTELNIEIKKAKIKM
tara:strand:- start:55 stop:555 length:501 start_codon:yes stop_codon:yes gene_type:complete